MLFIVFDVWKGDFKEAFKDNITIRESDSTVTSRKCVFIWMNLICVGQITINFNKNNYYY